MTDSTKRELRVACVGAGYFSQFQYEAWHRLDVDLAAICNKTEANARKIADTYGIAQVFTDFAQMLDRVKPDLVDIITPPATHVAYIELAAARGIPVICQKPFTPSLKEAEYAAGLMEDAGALLVIHENFRFQPWYGEIKRQIDAGSLGELYQVAFRLRPGDGQGPEAYLARQPYFQEMERFLVHETAIHLIDVFRYLFGEMTSVTAVLRRLNPAIKGEDAGVMLFDFENGTMGLFDGNRLSDHPANNRRLTMGEMMLEGSLGSLRLNGDGEVFLRRHGDDGEHRIDYDWQDRNFGGDCVFALQQHVVEHLRNGAPVMNRARDYLTNIRIEEAAYSSNELGKRVVL
ncbi:Gfo/Idh/MocA family protein [Pelagibius sp. Alg239-R121]|uniref:Gfo/Idh/MocA family protein n=1 Tax=Pelagibius sp. Alg239-R121 TaxID=2993448 RepID=UPI0024A6F33B|nr:Gfo/Idh/MocA family oxidoreductase [Pelagibius sp. Alg239-R121]